MGRYVRAAGVGDIPEGTGRPVALEGVEVAIFNLGGSFTRSRTRARTEGRAWGTGRFRASG
jgi:hypothetical protein